MFEVNARFVGTPVSRDLLHRLACAIRATAAVVTWDSESSRITNSNSMEINVRARVNAEDESSATDAILALARRVDGIQASASWIKPLPTAGAA